MSISIDRNSVFALSSGGGRTGVAVVRVSGLGSCTALDRIAGGCPPPRQATLRTLRCPATGEALDRALVLWFPGPASFTGEDMAEFHVHGGRAVVEAIIGALGSLDGMRPADPGDFTRRAFENEKLDLTEVEGLADLINAETEVQRKQALSQAQGGIRKQAENWRSDLVRAMAMVESALDFSDEGDVSSHANETAHRIVEPLAVQIARHLSDNLRGERLRDGFRVLLAGPPNVGKSSLLNALARRDAAIVSEEAGTTRDVIEVHLDLGGYPVLVMDTAGIRDARGAIEEEGIRRTLARAADADLVLWLVDATEPCWEPPSELMRGRADCVSVLNKVDKVPAEDVPGWDGNSLGFSAKTDDGLSALTDDLLCRVKSGLVGDETSIITRARHRQELDDCYRSLLRFLDGSFDQSELRAEDLRSAAAALGRLTGRIDVEEVLGRIFSDFCIGK